MAEKEKKLSAEQLKELEVQLRAQLQRAEELKAYYEAHPNDPDAFAAFAKNAAKVDTARMAQVGASGMASVGTAGLTKGTGISVAGAGPADMTKSLLMGFAFGGPIGMAAATFQAFQAGKNRQQNPKLCEAYESVAKEINAHGTDHLPSSPERRAAFVDAYNYATGRTRRQDMSDSNRDILTQMAANHKELVDKMDAIADKQTDLSNQIAELSAQLQPCRELASGILDSLPEGDEDSPLAERLYALTSSISAKVQQQVFTFLPKFDLYVGEQCVGTIRKEFTFLRPSFTLDFNGWRVEGSFMEWDYTIVDAAGQQVASVSKELFHWTDTYVIDVADEENALYALMVVLAIDAEKCSRN